MIICIVYWLVLARLIERLLPTREILGKFYLMSALLKRRNTEKEAENGQIFTVKSFCIFVHMSIDCM